MWKYIDQGGSSIPGVPAEDLSDEDFAAYAKSYAEINGFEPDALEKSGLYEHVADAKRAGRRSSEEE